MSKPKGYADLFALEEDERIGVIGRYATAGEVCNVVVEDDTKADRYAKKLLERFPTLEVKERFVGPANTVVVKIALKSSALQ